MAMNTPKKRAPRVQRCVSVSAATIERLRQRSRETGDAQGWIVEAALDASPAFRDFVLGKAVRK